MTQTNSIEVLLRLKDTFSDAYRQAVHELETGTTTARDQTEKTTSITQQLKESFDTLKEAAHGAFSLLEGNYSQLGNILGALPGPIGIVAGAVGGFVGDSITKVTALAGSVAQLQRTTGMTAEEASKLISVNKQMGISADDTVSIYTKFSRVIGGATDAEGYFANGGKGVAQVLFDQGIAATDATGKVRPLSELIPQIADRFKELGPGAEATALSIKLFGRNGAELLPVLLQGSEGIAKMSEKAGELGQVLDQQTVDAMKRVKVAQREWTEETDAIGLKLGEFLLPKLGDVATGFKTYLDNVEHINANGNILTRTIDSASNAFLFLTGQLHAATAAQLGWNAAANQADAVAAAHAPNIERLIKLTDQDTRATQEYTEASQANVEQYAKDSAAVAANAEADVAAKHATTEATHEAAAAARDAAKDQAEFAKQVSNVTSAFTAQTGPLDAAKVAEQAIALATGQTSVAQFENQRAASALAQAYKDHKISLDDVVAATSGLATGNLTAGQAFALAGQSGKDYSAQVNEVERAANSGAGRVDMLGRMTIAFKSAADPAHVSAGNIAGSIKIAGDNAGDAGTRMGNLALGAGGAGYAASDATPKVAGLGSAISGLSDKSVDVRANVSGAWDVANMLSMIDRLHDKTVSVMVNTYNNSSGPSMGNRNAVLQAAIGN